MVPYLPGARQWIVIAQTVRGADLATRSAFDSYESALAYRDKCADGYQPVIFEPTKGPRD